MQDKLVFIKLIEGILERNVTGVYTTPTQYASLIKLGSKKYRLVIMVRVNPSFIREPINVKDYWILDGKAN